MNQQFYQRARKAIIGMGAVPCAFDEFGLQTHYGPLYLHLTDNGTVFGRFEKANPETGCRPSGQWNHYYSPRCMGR